MMLMTISTVFPIMTQAGFDPVWFGIVMVILIELGLLTPPVGINLFVIQGISGGRPLGEVVAGAIPFVGLQLIGLALITVFPNIALWLPNTNALNNGTLRKYMLYLSHESFEYSTA